MSAVVAELLKTTPAVQIIFDLFNTYLITNGEKMLVQTGDSEEDTVRMLNKEFKVYFSAMKSNCCQHCFTVRAK